MEGGERVQVAEVQDERDGDGGCGCGAEGEVRVFEWDWGGVEAVRWEGVGGWLRGGTGMIMMMNKCIHWNSLRSLFPSPSTDPILAPDTPRYRSI